MKKIYFILSFATAVYSAQASDTLSVYTGKYVFPEGGPVPDVEVIVTDSSLIMTSTAGTSSLIYLGIDSFNIVEFSGTAVFKRGENGKINAVHIEAMGYVLDGKKEITGSLAFNYRPEKQGMVKPKSNQNL